MLKKKKKKKKKKISSFANFGIIYQWIYYDKTEFTTNYQNFIHKIGITDDSKYHRLAEIQIYFQKTRNTLVTILAIYHALIHFFMLLIAYICVLFLFCIILQ